MINNAHYWINARLVRPGDDHYTVDTNEGTVKITKTHQEAVDFCVASGESWYDNTAA